MSALHAESRQFNPGLGHHFSTCEEALGFDLVCKKSQCDNKVNTVVIFGILTLIIALTIAGVAAWFSIAGLMAIFGGAAMGVAVMAATLELGKIISVSWLYRNWHAKGWLKYYLILAVVVLMFITSLGIFGFLSRAHIEQSLSSTDNTVRIEQLDDRIVREQSKISDTLAVIAQLDNAVTVLQNNDRISGPNGAVALRLSQESERAKLNAVIDSANNAIDDLKMQRMPLNQTQIAKEVEVGPLKYVAELIYGKERAQENFDQAVRWVIIILVLVFDPLAVALLVAANQTLSRHGIHLEPSHPMQSASSAPPVESADSTASLFDSVNNAPSQNEQWDLFADSTKKKE